MNNNRTYICIDLKSFYASVECVLRNLDPLTNNLVVADTSRTEKTICLAVSPSLKSFGIPGRPRLFEVIQKVKEINQERRKRIGYRPFTGSSFNINELNSNPYLELTYIAATPQMAKYIELSSMIYDTYLKYIAKEDIHVYSIDEVFMDATNYLKGLNITAHELALKMVKDVLSKTGITATAGIGNNMYLAKVAMDIVAKHQQADKDGVRVAELDEMQYRELLWNHKPITDFWRVGHGIAKRLEKHGIYTMGDIAKCSVMNDYKYNEDLLYKEFGINAELLIDHAWGYEPTTIQDVKNYKPVTNSLSTGQVLHCGYDYAKTKLVIKEMTDLLALDLVGKHLVTKQLSLSISYDIDNLKDPNINYTGEIVLDYYGRKAPKGAHSSINLERYTSSSKSLVEAITYLYDYIVNPNLLIRKINISANALISEDKVIEKKGYIQLNMFEDYEEKEKRINEQIALEQKEKKIQKAMINIKNKYGKNSVLKGMNYEEGATTKDRNEQIGGHKA